MDTTLATFENDVIAASMQMPVLVDFWAPWCGPCQNLGPLLEKLESEAAGAWRLVKVDVDQNPELAAHFQVRSIPHVIAFAEGRPVDQFNGVLPENQLRAFIERLAPQATLSVRTLAQTALSEGRREEALTLLSSGLDATPDDDEIRLDLLELLLEDQRLDKARAEAARLSPKTTQGIDARYNAFKTRLDALDAAAALPPPNALAERVASHPEDLEARFDLANALIARCQYDEALNHLLFIVQRDRAFRDDIGRKTMLSVFELAAHQSARVAQWRRKLSAALN
ncbi:thioredoxin [Paraburkholderia hayleyella]|uniref:thioredoxin n=1 Tax=Paraburkholderia hayleyella TaxID=2152889 RepID=UPI0012908C88|nr:thioredoxin [Paraburkholderia hayleyella]